MTRTIAFRREEGHLVSTSTEVAGHDIAFLREIDITRWLHRDGTLTAVDPL